LILFGSILEQRMQSLAIRCYFLIICGIAFMCASGCGGPTFDVEGTVEMDGKPVDSGAISFEPADGKGRDFGGVITDGKFKFVTPPGVDAGKKIVRITGMQKTGKKISAFASGDAMVDEAIPFPKRYNETSELSANLEAGKVNRFDFKMKSAP
jgi:hypothetical protein